MAFSPLFDVSETEVAPASKPKKPSKSKFTSEQRGCDFCPLNKVKGIKKIKGSIKGRKILVVGQSPGPEENDQEKELIGPSGQLLWDELRAVGILRKHCDVFNSVKCFPADRVEGSYNSYLKMRSPSKAEIHCCSIYTEEHMAQSQADQILVLGAVAAKALLNVRSVPTQKSFWSNEFKAKIYLLTHPAFFVRGYGEGPKMEEFRSTLKRVAEERGGVSADMSDDFAYVKSQDYRLVVNEEQALEAERIIRSYAEKGRRISVDIESDVFDEVCQTCHGSGFVDVNPGGIPEGEGCPDCPGGPVYQVFCVGFCPKPGLSFVMVFRHKDVSEKNGRDVLKVVRRLVEDETIEKVLHYGVSDSMALVGLE